MYELFRIGLINWHILPSMDIPVTGDIGVIGENRSGKSTLLDLLQIVITGNDGRYRRLNASASDSGRKRGERSVHAYCLGRLGPDTVLRPEARTYIFLGFRNTHRPHEVTTIGLALEASERETGEQVQAQFIARGLALSVQDLLYDREDGTQGVREWDLARPHLERLCAEAGGGLQFYRNEPGKYVADYLKILSTGQRFVQTDQLLKAFVNAISFEQIPNATEFVRRYLLEQDDIRIGQLRQSIATYHQLQKDIARLREKLEALEDLRGRVEAFGAAVATYDRNQWLEARAGFDASFRANRALRRKRDAALADVAEAGREVAEYERLLGELEEERQSLEAAIHSQTQGSRMQELKARSKVLQTQLAQALATVKQVHAAIGAGTVAATAPEVRDILPMPVAGAMARLGHVSGTALPPAWPTDPAGVAKALDDAALTGLEDLGRRCLEEADRLVRAQGEPEKALADIGKQIQDIRVKGVTLDPTVLRLVEELEDRGLKPRIVGHLLTVTDPSWRDAVEALLGRDREAVLVDDADVDEAIRHLQSSRRRLRGCRIVNTRKIDTSQTRPEPGTLASVLASDDSAAMAFVIRRIGNVRLAETLHDLHRPGRAIMRDGTYDDGLAVEMREVQGGYRIGPDAGRHRLPTLEKEERELRDLMADLKRQVEAHRRLSAGLAALAPHAGNGEGLLGACSALETTGDALDQVAKDMADLERNIDPKLKERADGVRAQMATYRAELQNALFKQKDGKRLVGDATSALNGGEQIPGSGLHRRNAYRTWLRRKPFLGREESRRAYAQERESVRDDLPRLAREAGAEANKFRDEMESRSNAVFDKYLAYHMLSGSAPALERASFNVARDVAPWVEESLARIRDTELVQYEAEATEAADKTRNIFQHSFAYELRKRFAKMDRTLDKLNKTLREHQFHYETYRFQARSLEHMRDIIALVRASQEDDTLFALLFDQDIDPEHPHAKALKTVRELLLDDQLDIAEFEDYRRYYTFTMIMKDASGRETDLDARRGTGSGAEQQVPFYVAIGSALAAAYHDKAAGDPAAEKGIGLAVFDEAFSKLDGKNQKACMDFYEKLGLQVVVAAPLEKRATLYETMESFIETIRVGDLVDIEAYEVRDRARQAFAEANPANVSLEDLRRFMSEPA